MFLQSKTIKTLKEIKTMSWTTFQEVGKLREAAKESKCGAKVDLSNGVHFVFPDGWKIEAKHHADRAVSVIAGWLDMLWTIRTGKII